MGLQRLEPEVAALESSYEESIMFDPHTAQGIPQALEIVPGKSVRMISMLGSSTQRGSCLDRMKELASRVETAEPDSLSRQELVEIFRLCRPRSAFGSSEACDIGRELFIRFWIEGATESAAIKLMDADWFWRVGHDGDGLIPLFNADVMDAKGDRHTATAETASCALTAAALRAHAWNLKPRRLHQRN
jgi:hypothetical protein